MSHLCFEIRHADGRQERTAAQAPRIVIGSGAHCDVRLSADQAAFEQVVIEDQPAGPLVRNLAATVPTTLDGVPLSARLLGPSATVCIGATQIHITHAEQHAVAKRSGLGPAMIAKLLVVAGLVAAIVEMSTMSADAPIAKAPAMPELFAAPVAACPRTDLAEARAVADDQRANGDGARDRSPFDPRESRVAIKSYEIAAACYRLTRSVEASEDAAQNARRMREETLLDFRARRVRLERVLLVNDYELAAQDVAILSALTEGQQGEYPRWLATVAQEIKNHNSEKSR
ncbi:MAG TPA: FHA domain-containing protein [Labilithrix sp.]|nr:FHA domain-containing protein [Labilithrix sp.]